MEPSTLYSDPSARPKPSRWWTLITIAAGAVGALAAIAAGGKGSYVVTPFTVDLSARPAAYGKTELAIEPSNRALAALVPRGRAEAGTHAAPMVFRASITGLGDESRVTRSDRIVFSDPAEAASFLSSDGREALRSFGIKLALLAVGGGAAAGAVIGMRRPRRIVGAAVSGLLCFAVIGLLVQQTYDKSEFGKTRYVFEQPPPGVEIPVQR